MITPIDIEAIALSLTETQAIPKEGDIVVALSAPGSDGLPEYVLVLNTYENDGLSPDCASCVLVTRRTDLAIHRDIIISQHITGMEGADGSLVIHSLTDVLIPYSRLSSPLGHCEDAVLQEIIDCRYSYPSDDYKHGERLLPIGDHRTKQLTTIYRSFDETFSVTEDEKKL